MSSLTLGSNNELFLDWMWRVMESGFYMTTYNDQFNGWAKKKLQSTFQNQTCTKKEKGHGHCLVVCCQIWSTTALWAPMKPLHLRSMLSKSMRCTENCNTCSWRWSTERAQLISMITPDFMLQNQATKASKVEQIGLRTLVSSATFILPLSNLQLLQASWWLFTGKQASTTSRRQKIFAK